MKKLLSIFLVGLVATFALAQTGPIYAPQTLGTFRVAAQAATNVAFVIDCRKQKNVSVQIDNQMSTSATDNQTLYYSTSADGITFSSAFLNVPFGPVASTASTVVTNLDTKGAGYIRIEYFTNAAASAISTNTIQYAVKIGAP